MAELTTVARPYAKAAFQFAMESNALEQWSNTLGRFALIAADASVKSFLMLPQVSNKEKVNLFIDLLEKAPAQAVENLLLQLASNKRLSILPAIFVLFETLLAEHLKTQDVNVFSAFELSEAELDKLNASLKKRLGREINLKTSIDERLIGGVLIRAGDLVIDASVKGKLAKLTHELNT